MECGRPPVLVPGVFSPFFQSKDKGPNESVVSRWNVNEKKIEGPQANDSQTEEMPCAFSESNGWGLFLVRDLQQFTRVCISFSDLLQTTSSSDGDDSQ